jgi:hypothetical protein
MYAGLRPAYAGLRPAYAGLRPAYAGLRYPHKFYLSEGGRP